MMASPDVNENLREMCCVGHVDETKRLIAAGADVNSPNKVNGWTSLHWAVKRNNVDVVELLASNGADASLTTQKGETVFDLAQSEEMLVSLLKCRNVNIELYDNAIARVDLKTAQQCNQANKQDADFTPSYLANPVFPYWDGKRRKAAHEELSTQTNNLALTENSAGCGVEDTKKVHSASERKLRLPICEKDYMVLKIRVQCKNEEDFIEIEFNNSNPSYNDFLLLCCKELDVASDVVLYIRKLPNTRMRNNGDVSRLADYQELELVLKAKH